MGAFGLGMEPSLENLIVLALIFGSASMPIAGRPKPYEAASEERSVIRQSPFFAMIFRIQSNKRTQRIVLTLCGRPRINESLMRDLLDDGFS